MFEAALVFEEFEATLVFHEFEAARVFEEFEAPEMLCRLGKRVIAPEALFLGFLLDELVCTLKVDLKPVVRTH